MPIQDYYRQHKKLVNLAGIALVAIVTLGMVMKSRSARAKYLTAAVQQGDITAVVQATGTINPLTTVPVGSYVSGTVKFIFADFNSRVHAGQVLAQLDPAIYEAQVIQARGNLANALANEKNLEASIAGMQAAIESDQANVVKVQAAAQYALANNKRIQDLAQQGVISQDQADMTHSNLQQADAGVRGAQAQLDQARAQLDQTRAQLEQARAQVQVNTGVLKQAETNLRYTTIVSPIDGTIVARDVTVGQSVAASLQAPVVFSIAQDLTRMQVYAATDESDTGSVKIGTEVTFQVDAFPAETFQGRVSAIRLNATTIQNVVTYSTIVDFENPDEKLLPGETAYVTIPTGHAANCIKIPNAALRFTPEMPRPQLQELYKKAGISSTSSAGHPGGWRVVWKLDKDGGILPVKVRAGITDYSFTQLIEGELKEGDLLVTGEETASSAGTQSPMGGPRMGGPGGRR
jgi:HlyD family secretion protein